MLVTVANRRTSRCPCRWAVFSLTMACEGRVMEPLDRAARRKHMQIPTFMTVEKEMK